jgi:hypothetical protein
MLKRLLRVLSEVYDRLFLGLIIKFIQSGH